MSNTDNKLDEIGHDDVHKSIEQNHKGRAESGEDLSENMEKTVGKLAFHYANTGPNNYKRPTQEKQQPQQLQQDNYGRDER